MVFGALVLVVGIYVLTLRARYVFRQQARTLRTERWSWLGRRSRDYSFDVFDRVELRNVRAPSSAHQASPIGDFTMVFVCSPTARVQLTSERGEAAQLVGRQVGQVMGLPVRNVT